MQHLQGKALESALETNSLGDTYSKPWGWVTCVTGHKGRGAVTHPSHFSLKVDFGLRSLVGQKRLQGHVVQQQRQEEERSHPGGWAREGEHHHETSADPLSQSSSLTWIHTTEVHPLYVPTRPWYTLVVCVHGSFCQQQPKGQAPWLNISVVIHSTISFTQEDLYEMNSFRCEVCKQDS